MEQPKFKIGDKVKRIKTDFGCYKIGSIYTVAEIRDGEIRAEEANHWWGPFENFELVPQTWKERLSR